MREKLAQMVIEYYSGNRRAIEVADQILKYQIEEIKKVENQYPDYISEGKRAIFDDGFDQCLQKIIKKLEVK